jgi:hypothetical protein
MHERISKAAQTISDFPEGTGTQARWGFLPRTQGFLLRNAGSGKSLLWLKLFLIYSCMFMGGIVHWERLK